MGLPESWNGRSLWAERTDGSSVLGVHIKRSKVWVRGPLGSVLEARRNCVGVLSGDSHDFVALLFLFNFPSSSFPIFLCRMAMGRGGAYQNCHGSFANCNIWQACYVPQSTWDQRWPWQKHAALGEQNSQLFPRSQNVLPNTTLLHNAWLILEGFCSAKCPMALHCLPTRRLEIWVFWENCRCPETQSHTWLCVCNPWILQIPTSVRCVMWMGWGSSLLFFPRVLLAEAHIVHELLD